MPPEDKIHKLKYNRPGKVRAPRTRDVDIYTHTVRMFDCERKERTKHLKSWNGLTLGLTTAPRLEVRLRSEDFSL